MNKPLQCGIIGYGYMGEIRHRMVSQHPGTELLMICETNPEKLAEDYEFAVVRDSNELLESDVDVVFICTPNHLIPDLAIKCLERGKNIFCEKPPGRSLSDIVRMMNAEKENPSAKLMFGFNHRYHPGVMKAKAIVDSGRMGRVIALRGHYGKSGGNDFSKSWRNNIEISGGGILLDQGIHMLDLFNCFLGGFTSVKSFLTNSYWSFNVEDNAVVILKNEDDQLAMLHSSATFWKHMFQLNIILEQGYLTLEGLLSKTGSYGRETLVIGRRQFEDEVNAIGNPVEEKIYFDNDVSWELEVSKFVEYILNDKPVTECSSRDAYNAMELVHRCYQDSGFKTYREEVS